MVNTGKRKCGINGYNVGFKDYHYRQSDREIGAMSPMFLGGLTARAMALASGIKAMGIAIVEVYPAGLVKHLGIREHYKKDVKGFEKEVFRVTGIDSGLSFDSWHQVDAFLAWNSGRRWSRKEHITIGNPDEGVISVDDIAFVHSTSSFVG